MSSTLRWSQRRAEDDSTPVRNEDATASPTSVRLLVDTAAPTAPTFVPDAATTSSASLATEPVGSATSGGMSSATKVGLAMIPVVVILVGVYILFLFWYRRRRAARNLRLRGLMSPPVPEKDFSSSYNSSIASRRQSSKVLNMAAFTTPLDGTYPKPMAVGQSAAREQPPRGLGLSRIQERSRDNVATRSPQPVGIRREPTFSAKKKGHIHINMAAANSCPNISEADTDSPIDGRSPFRLKRGDTVKRHSLGSDLLRLWPTPPTSVWMQPMSVYDDVYNQKPPVRNQRQSSTYRQPSSRFSE
ncbi:hypothetical protein CC86DRAFT_147618 [Ophiobolus disseminans]|uniref:Uncharacterized protein n=1 Tax=Ophiobolus disseminans TaxID=1469910 RepID=A0A6A6ZDH6_9PLEO|nr:hypothetical protein CC86DRAFT_147618 [Ophiobolus disseminans]